MAAFYKIKGFDIGPTDSAIKLASYLAGFFPGGDSFMSEAGEHFDKQPMVDGKGFQVHSFALLA